MKTPGTAELQLGEGCGEVENMMTHRVPTPGECAELGLGGPGKDGPKSGWYSRGYLPHYNEPGILQFITFRLADSMPREKLMLMEQELALLPSSSYDSERRKKMERWLDAGAGCCALRHPAVAEVMRETLTKFDGDRYRLISWCVMPNHVHVLIETKEPMAKIVQSWKSFTGRWAMARNAELGLGVPGKAFWMREYWDRYIRDERHFYSTVSYIHDNPVKAGLCGKPHEWPWSSAFGNNV